MLSPQYLNNSIDIFGSFQFVNHKQFSYRYILGFHEALRFANLTIDISKLVIFVRI